MKYGGPIDPRKTVVLPDTIAWTVTRLRIARTVLGTAEPCGEDEAMDQVITEIKAMIDRLEARLPPELR